MGLTTLSEWSGQIGELVIGASGTDGGTRSHAVTIGGDRDLPYIGIPPSGHIPLVAYELTDDPSLWQSAAIRSIGDRAHDPSDWAAFAEKELQPDLIRLYLSSTRRRGFSDLSQIGKTVEAVLQATKLPLIIEGSNDPALDSSVFRKIGEAAEGERVLLGTAESGRYRSAAAAAMAYGHSLIAQSPIDINLAKQLNILLRETGLPHDRIAIDPYTGALGYGFEYSYSVMERIRYSALKGDTDLAMPLISSAADSLTVKEVREAEGGDADQAAVAWEMYSMLPATLAGASIVCVRHPLSIAGLKSAIASLWNGQKSEGV